MLLWRRLSGKRKKWTHADVVDVPYPAFAVRTYLEHRDLRAYLAYVAERLPIRHAIELGCGYGRMTMVLSEYAQQVEGFEREPELVAAAAAVLPAIRFVQVESLGAIPLDDACCEFAMTFTVLQHHRNAEVGAPIAELKRIVRPGGYILLCEESDPKHVAGQVNDPLGHATVGRTAETYAGLLAPCTLEKSSPRAVEPTQSRSTGAYLLFRKP